MPTQIQTEALQKVALAIIPVRGGSKGIPGKNLKTVGGLSLVARAVLAAKAAKQIQEVAVSSDSEELLAEAERYGAIAVRRPAELANDTASSEVAVLDAIEQLRKAGHTAEVTVFIQATSPFINSADLDQAVTKVATGQADSVFSAFETYAFLWQPTETGAVGVNHDHSFRPRRQDRDPHYQETGAFYVFDTAGFERARFRFFGKVAIQEVAEATAVEIDNLEQLRLAQTLAELSAEPSSAVGAIADSGAAKPSASVDFSKLKALVTDFDGVHTDDAAYLSQDGLESVRVSRSDGMGVSLLKQAGIPLLILSKEKNPVVGARAQKLGVEVLQGIDEKLPALANWAAEKGLELAEIAYLGNDINDLSCLEAVGWSVAVADAHRSVLSQVQLVLTKPGGNGAIRELVELILSSKMKGNNE